jgi:protein O-mannosyl-transferase
LLAPLHLTPEYGRTPEWLLQSGTWRWSWIVPALVAAIAVWAAWRHRFAPLGLFAAFVLVLAPVLGLVPFLYQKYSTVADHYMYLPFLLVSLSVSLLLAEIASARRAMAVVTVLATAGVFTVLSFIHQPVWRSDDTLFPYAIEQNPRSTLLRMDYGESLFERGRYEESLAQFQAAAEIRPHADIYYNIGSAEAILKRYADAKRAFEQALSMNPTDPDIIRSLDNLKRLLGR